MPESSKAELKIAVKQIYPWWVPFVLVIFGLLLRFLALSQRESIGIDSVRYITFARNYIAGIFHTIGPTGLHELPDIGYPLLIVIWRGIFGGDLELTAGWISLTAGTLTIVVIYLLALKFTGQKQAIYALFLAAVCPPLIEYSSLIQTESLFIFVFAASVALSHSARKRGYNSFWFLIGGICSAYAYLTRGIGITFLVMFPLVVLIMGMFEGDFKRTVNKRKFIFGLVAFIFGFVLIALPYQIMLSRTYGRFVLSDQSIWHTPRMAHPEVDFSADPRYDGTLTADGSDYLINTPAYYNFPASSVPSKVKAFVGKYLKNQIGIYYYHLRELFPPVFLFLIVLGLFVSTWEPAFKRGMMLFGLWSVPFLILQPFFYTEARYVAPVAIFLMIVAGRGFVNLLSWLEGMFQQADKKRVEWICAVLIFIILTPVMIYPLTHRGPKYDYPELRWAGLYLAEYISKNGGDGVLSVTPIVGYYADAKSNLVLPRTNIDGVVRFAKQKGTRFVVLEERKVYGKRPELREILYTDSIPYGLKLIYDNKDDSGYRVRIFDIY